MKLLSPAFNNLKKKKNIQIWSTVLKQYVWLKPTHILKTDL